MMEQRCKSHIFSLMDTSPPDNKVTIQNVTIDWLNKVVVAWERSNSRGMPRRNLNVLTSVVSKGEHDEETEQEESEEEEEQ